MTLILENDLRTILTDKFDGDQNLALELMEIAFVNLTIYAIDHGECIHGAKLFAMDPELTCKQIVMLYYSEHIYKKYPGVKLHCKSSIRRLEGTYLNEVHQVKDKPIADILPVHDFLLFFGPGKEVTIELGEYNDVLDRYGKWYAARILSLSTETPRKAKVHFIGFKRTWDETIKENEFQTRIMPIGSKSLHNWRRIPQTFHEQEKIKKSITLTIQSK